MSVKKAAIGALLIITVVLLIATVIVLWPAVAAAQDGELDDGKRWSVNLVFGLFSLSLTADTVLFLLVVVFGALGAYVHAATSFADFVGNRRFVGSWTWWYFLRLPIGATLALLLYVALRAGFFTAGTEAEAVNPYGVAALAGLSGLFSKQATDKLREVFTTMFQVSAGDNLRKDSLAPPRPTITAVERAPQQPGPGEGLAIQVTGSDFAEGATIEIDGQPVATTPVEGTDALVATSPRVPTEEEPLSVTVRNPGDDGGVSDAFSFSG